MRIDVAKNNGALSRCKVCGRYFTWKCPENNIVLDKKGKRRPAIEPEHCGSSVCEDFMRYYRECNKKETTDFEYAKYRYLKKKGIM